MEKIAIIAGVGELPYLFLEVAKEYYDIHVLAFFEECDSRLKSHENYLQVSFSDIPRAMTYLISQQIQKVIMLGKVEKSLIFGTNSSQSSALELLNELKDKKDETIIFEIINFLKHSGIEVMPQNFMLEHFMVEKKIYTNIHPTSEDEKTIQIGLEAAKMLTTLDIGQTVVCKDASVVALEGIEGTDKTIARAGKYAGTGTIIVKVARPS
ncbi:MAG: UDP-2,3-diacylglucosamine diphosphatase LpxI, partial [Fusobacteria bacterium]|nr:UDP-2,3-diacylglucosamine diphosphatase LpxI [Fusobacteriota bacterium]